MSQMEHMSAMAARDHGGGLDAAIARYGGQFADWLDLSTGINPVPYPVAAPEARDWTALPDRVAQTALTDAARSFWRVPDQVAILAAPGASALIARLPGLFPAGQVVIETPTYNEHAAGFSAAGWQVTGTGPADARVMVHPNNPDGRIWQARDIDTPFTVIDESFCDVMPEASLIEQAAQPGCIVLKSFGKFWGLAGLRLGFAMALPATIERLAEMLGPWPVSGPALRIGAHALNDHDWADTTRARLACDAARLDRIMGQADVQITGGTDLFRLYSVRDAAALQDRLARHHIWTRIFPYSDHLIRLGLPPADGWAQIEAAL